MGIALFVSFSRAAAVFALAAFLQPLYAANEVAHRQPFGDNIHDRGSLNNSRLRFEREKKGTVAFLGGSITEREGYRPLVYAILKKRFPNTAFTFTNAGIASTCSNTGAFRLDRDVFQHGPVDLLFVEFAVNDDQDGKNTRKECIRGMEGRSSRTRACSKHCNQERPR